MEWGAIIYALLGIAAYFIKDWIDKAPGRAEERFREFIQAGRIDISEGNVTAVNERIDRLLTETRSVAKSTSSEITAERIGSVSGLAAKRGDVSKDSGECGTL